MTPGNLGPFCITMLEPTEHPTGNTPPPPNLKDQMRLVGLTAEYTRIYPSF